MRWIHKHVTRQSKGRQSFGARLKTFERSTESAIALSQFFNQTLFHALTFSKSGLALKQYFVKIIVHLLKYVLLEVFR